MNKNELLHPPEDGQRPMFTREEIEIFLQEIRSSYDMVIELLHANEDGILIRHRNRTNQGQSLVQSSITELKFLLEIPKEHLARGGEIKKVTVSQDVYQGGMSLVGTLVLAEQGVDQNTEALLVSTVTNMALRHKDLYGSNMSLSDQAAEYLRGVDYTRRCNSIFKKDPSGFALIDGIVSNLDNPYSLFYTATGRQPRDFFGADLREAADLYKEIYLIGSQNGLGPQPEVFLKK